VWIGYYSEAYDTFTPWFFQKDYGPSLSKGLREFGHLCLAGVFALLYFITFNVLDVLTGCSVVRTGDQEMRHKGEVKAVTYFALLLSQWLGFWFRVDSSGVWVLLGNHDQYTASRPCLSPEHSQRFICLSCCGCLY